MHFVGFIDLRFLFIIIRKVPKDRKVMPEAGLIYDKFCCPITSLSLLILSIHAVGDRREPEVGLRRRE